MEIGKVFSVNCSKIKGISKTAVGEAGVIKNFGLKEDAHRGPGLRQVSLLAIEAIKNQAECPKAKKADGPFGPGDFSENITTQGLNLDRMKVGDILKIGKSVVLEVSKIGKECHKHCAIYSKAGDCVMPREGIFAKVSKSGKVAVGDDIEVVKRTIDYLRISVTDRCNLRCVYCVPAGGIKLSPRSGILSLEEIARLANIFASLGIKKIRLTGGDPLVRKGLLYLIRSLVATKGIEEVSLSTNGLLLPFYAERLKEYGVKRVNVSLDTLDDGTFERVTGKGALRQVLEGIRKAKELGFDSVKLNTVIMKGINYREIPDFVNFALREGLILRFIEFMKVTPLWKEGYYIPIEEIKDICRRQFKLERVGAMRTGPAEYYKVNDSGRVGFIKTDENNCRSCNRLRLTSTGELKICLYENNGMSLKELLRGPKTDKEIREAIAPKVEIKQHTDYSNYESAKLYMSNIGG